MIGPLVVTMFQAVALLVASSHVKLPLALPPSEKVKLFRCGRRPKT
jgi:hypothetical protein